MTHRFASFSSLLVSLALAACGPMPPNRADGGAQSTADGGQLPRDAGGATTPSPCAAFCAVAQQARCPNAAPDCVARCQSAEVPAACRGAFDAALACHASTGQVRCAADGTIEPFGCERENAALEACLNDPPTNPPPPATERPAPEGLCLPRSATSGHDDRCSSVPATPRLYECSPSAPFADCVPDPSGGNDLWCCQ